MTVELPRIFANQIRSYQDILVTTQGGMKDFPLLSIDTDSYIVQAEIHSGLLSKDLIADRHCIAIGKGCSLADKITFMIDQNHNYRAVSQGFPLFLGKTAASEPMGQRKDMIKLKGSIIIQNDVWVGYGVTIMSGGHASQRVHCGGKFGGDKGRPAVHDRRRKSGQDPVPPFR